MATTFKYASQTDLKNYFNRFGEFDQKVQIFPTLTSTNLHLFRDCGYIDTFFINGEEQAAAQGTSGAVDSNGEWFYNSSTNQLEYYNSNYSSTTINEQIFEAGVDFATFIDQQLVNASLELHNLLDAKFASPIPKNNQILEASAGVGTGSEYDPIIIKAVCYITASNLIRSKSPMDEEADYYYSLVTNPEGTGICDKLNDGKYKLSYETDKNDSKGSVRYITQAGSMRLVETAGEYYGEDYDLIKITCSDAGAYGVAKCTVEYYGSDKLLGSSSTGNIVTGSLDYWSGLGGLGVRFQGATMNASDVWEIEVKSAGRAETNTATYNIELNRGVVSRSSRGSLSGGGGGNRRAYVGGGTN